MQKGFTLIEIMVVISITVIIAAFSAPFAFRFFALQNLDATSLQIVTSLRQARNQALAQKNDYSSGVYFSNDYYVVFQGDSYALRNTDYDTQIDLPGSVTVSGISEIVFEQDSGIPSTTGSLVVQGIESRFITINSQGIVSLQ